MGDSQTITPKYVIKATFEVEGVVERSDVIGAIFGQTEGLFGPDLDLHELQKNGRIGRIDIQMETKQDRSKGEIIVPTSLDKPITALTAAAIESVDRIGPCSAHVTLKSITDVRETRRESIINRAQAILHEWIIESTPTIEQLTDKVSEIIKPIEIISYGPDKLSAGPNIDSSKSIIIVEGRADVANLLRSGIKNVLACEGTKIPKTIMELSKRKEVTAFLDGDRGGDLILKGLQQVAKIDYVARAPRGFEVEQLAPKQVLKALNEKRPFKEVGRGQVRKRRTIPKKEKPMVIPKPLSSLASKLKGTLEAALLNDKQETVEQIPVSELCSRLREIDGINAIVFDGVITQRLVDIAGDKGIKLIIGDRISGVVKRPIAIQLLTVDKNA